MIDIEFQFDCICNFFAHCFPFILENTEEKPMDFVVSS